MKTLDSIKSEIEKLEDIPEAILHKLLNEIQEFTVNRITLEDYGEPLSVKKPWDEIQQGLSSSEGCVNYMVSIHTSYLNDKIDGEFPENEILDRIYDGHTQHYNNQAQGTTLEQVCKEKKWGAITEDWMSEDDIQIFKVIEQIVGYITQNATSLRLESGLTVGEYIDSKENLQKILDYADAKCKEICGWSIEDIRIQLCKESIASKQEKNVPEGDILMSIQRDWLTPEQVGYTPKNMRKPDIAMVEEVEDNEDINMVDPEDIELSMDDDIEISLEDPSSDTGEPWWLPRAKDSDIIKEIQENKVIVSGQELLKTWVESPFRNAKQPFGATQSIYVMDSEFYALPMWLWHKVLEVTDFDKIVWDEHQRNCANITATACMVIGIRYGVSCGWFDNVTKCHSYGVLLVAKPDGSLRFQAVEFQTDKLVSDDELEKSDMYEVGKETKGQLSFR